jgi:hypothetical protein
MRVFFYPRLTFRAFHLIMSTYGWKQLESRFTDIRHATAGNCLKMMQQRIHIPNSFFHLIWPHVSASSAVRSILHMKSVRFGSLRPGREHQTRLAALNIHLGRGPPGRILIFKPNSQGDHTKKWWFKTQHLVHHKDHTSISCTSCKRGTSSNEMK